MTEICNFKCKGCRRSIIDVHKSKDIDLKIVQKLLSHYPQLKGFCLAGQGEPTLCRNFVEIVDYLKKRKKYVYIVTNASDITKFLELKTAPDSISISLYGFDNDSYQRYCGLAVFDNVIENFKVLKTKFKQVGFSYIVSKENYFELEKVLKLCDEIQPDFLNLVNYLAYDENSEEEINKIINVQDVEIINHINNLLSENRAYVKSTPHYINPDSTCFKCCSYLQAINVDGQGNIGGCRSHIVPDSVYGNIFNEKDAFNSSEMLKLRNLAKNKTAPHDCCKYCFRREQ
jgi:radical SAM protein with 4Fe4S-binding SPASM domain